MRVVRVVATYELKPGTKDEREAFRRALHHFHSELEKWKRGDDWASRMWDLEVVE
jgi:hypothetical protein